MASLLKCSADDCDFDTVDPDLFAMHRQRQHGIAEPPPAAHTPPRQAGDPLDRIEWQLNQIRLAVITVAVVAVMGVLGGLALWFVS